jgi:hypothetical protein
VGNRRGDPEVFRTDRQGPLRAMSEKAVRIEKERSSLLLCSHYQKEKTLQDIWLKTFIHISLLSSSPFFLASTSHQTTHV